MADERENAEAAPEVIHVTLADLIADHERLTFLLSSPNSLVKINYGCHCGGNDCNVDYLETREDVDGAMKILAAVGTKALSCVDELPTHCCGKQGFNSMLGDVCPACPLEERVLD